MELLVIIIVLALIFDYINGFHDAANSMQRLGYASGSLNVAARSREAHNA